MTHGEVEDQLDLQAYFRRIGYTGERTSTLAILQAIHLRHATAIPFENLTPLLHQLCPAQQPADDPPPAH